MNRSSRNQLFIGTLAVVLLLAGAAVFHMAATSRKSVRVLYLVPKDREYRQDYHDAIETCVRNLQNWYRQQLSGQVFLLHNGNVEVKHTPHDADWYNNHAPVDRPDPVHYTYYNALADAAALIYGDGANYVRFISDPDYVWLVYIDAPGGTGAGEKGVAVLPRHDLEGLIGKSNDRSSVNRWIGGSGHELGHAFGLLHPGDQHQQAIMQAGYSTYPDCYLTQFEVQMLKESPFFHDDSANSRLGPEVVSRFCLIAAAVVVCWGIGTNVRRMLGNPVD